MNSDLTLPIRPAIAAEIPAILALEQASATAAHFSKEKYIEIVDQGLKFFEAGRPQPGGDEKGCQSRLALVMEEDSQVKGFLIARRLDAEWEIENIVTAEGARMRGFGAALMGEFLKIARQQGGQQVYLEVRESNMAARRLYEKHQFAETGRRKNYYNDPHEDAILYALQLE